YTLYSQQKDFSFKGFTRVAPLYPHSADCFSARGEFSINPISLLTGLEEEVSKRGVQVFRGVECFDLRGKTLQTSLGEIRAGEVVLARNGYTNSLVGGLVTPQRAQMLCVETIKDISLPGLIYEPDSRVYFKAIAPHKLIIGGKRLIDPLIEETSHL